MTESKKKLKSLTVVGALVLLGFMFGCNVTQQPPVASFWYSPTSPVVGEQMIFNASASYDPDAKSGPGIEAYEWEFGDGATADGETVSHVYEASGQYSVTLTVTDSSGGIGTATDLISVGDASPNPPVAVISFTPTDPQVDEVVTFSAEGSYDPAGFAPKAIVSYEWNFGDGSTGQGSSVQHIFSQAGAFLVTLEVTDDDGVHGTARATVYVSAHSTSNQPPVARFTFSPTSPYINQEVTFSADESYDPSGVAPCSIVLYSWDFGDGGTAVGKTVSHAYATAGTFSVRLTVSDDKGASGTTTDEIVVQNIVIPPPPPPPGG